MSGPGELGVIEARAEAMFDALVINPDGMTTRELFDHLVGQNLAEPTQSIQIVGAAMRRLRRLLAGFGEDFNPDVIPCRKGSHESLYWIAANAPEANDYRRSRSTEIATQITTLARQVETERERFNGDPVFTDAALDYFAMGIRELERAGSMRITTTP